MLREGGYVLVMRHTSSPREAPEPREADPRNVNRERELDDLGRAHATAVGYAFRALDVDIGVTMSSPTFRAIETLIYLGYKHPQVVDELAPGEENGEWLRRKAAEAPAEEGTNTLIVTHAPNISAAFGDAADGVAEGETLVIDPRGGTAEVVGRITVKEWAVLAVEQT
ncbi:MAG TPA: hypothetical protein VF329_03930 [Gammaproteobacteria bacterium]